MLPRDISEELGSLSEGKRRSALMFRIQLDNELNVTRFKPSVENVTVDRRLQYEDITALLANPQHPFFEPVKAATRIAQMLLAQRRKHGALAFYDLTLTHQWSASTLPEVRAPSFSVATCSGNSAGQSQHNNSATCPVCQLRSTRSSRFPMTDR